MNPENFTPQHSEKEEDWLVVEKNPLLSEHLHEGIRPIMACMTTWDDFRTNKETWEEFRNYFERSEMLNVDYEGDPGYLKQEHFKNAGVKTYTISPIDSFGKFSESFKNCTGLIVAGVDRVTGEEISFLTHQDPTYFLQPEHTSVFLKDLETHLLTMHERCQEGTVDAVIVGGNWLEGKEEFQRNYSESLDLISSEVKKTLGFEPVVLTKPKNTPGADDVYYDTLNRRLFLLRGNSSGFTPSFLASEAKRKEKEWDRKPGEDLTWDK